MYQGARFSGFLKSVFVVAAIAALTESAAQATLLTIANSSFESPVVGVDGGLGGVPAGWANPSGASGVRNPTASQYTGAGGVGGVPSGGAGSQVALVTGFGAIQQTLTNVLEIGTYTLTVAVGDRADATMDQWRLDLYSNSGVNLLATTNGSSEALADGVFTDVTLLYNATALSPGLGTPLQVRLVNHLGSLTTATEYDNVRLDFVSAVPEPTTFGLLLVGGALTWRRSRRWTL